MNDIFARFSAAHDALRLFQRDCASSGKGHREPLGGFTILWDGIEDLAPPFEIKCCGKHANATSLEQAVELATSAMEKFLAEQKAGQ